MPASRTVCPAARRAPRSAATRRTMARQRPARSVGRRWACCWKPTETAPMTMLPGRRQQNAGLPQSCHVAEIRGTAEMCDMPVATLKSKPGFLQTYDLNGDGRDDYIIDGAHADCMFTCGAANCTVYRLCVDACPAAMSVNEFLARRNGCGHLRLCAADGTCRFRDTGREGAEVGRKHTGAGIFQAAKQTRTLRSGRPRPYRTMARPQWASTPATWRWTCRGRKPEI